MFLPRLFPEGFVERLFDATSMASNEPANIPSAQSYPLGYNHRLKARFKRGIIAQVIRPTIKTEKTSALRASGSARLAMTGFMMGGRANASG